MIKAIWIVNQYAGSIYHGKEYRSPPLARELAKQGIDVTVIEATRSHHFSKAPQTNALFAIERIDGVRYVWIRTFNYRSSKSLWRFLSMVEFILKLVFIPKRLLPIPDCIMVSSPSPLPIFIAKRWQKQFKSTLIFEVRDLWPLSIMALGNLSSTHPIVRFFGWVESFAYRHSDAVVSIPPLAEEYMRTKGLPPKRFFHIPNGYEKRLLQDNTPPPTAVLKKIPSDKFIVGYAGALGIANDLDTLLKAAHRLTYRNDIVFALLGSGSEENKLKQFAQELKLNNVIFLGSVDKQQVRKIIEKFDVCYLGLRDSSLFQYGVSPTKLYDYMAAAKPILYAVSSGNHPVQSARCGLEINHPTPQTIAEAILTLRNIPADKLNRMGQSGYRTLMKYYTYDRLAVHLLDIMLEIKR